MNRKVDTSTLMDNPLPRNLSAVAYTLADSLRQQYLDKGLTVPIDERKQVIAKLMENFAITQKQAESALATGFFESR